MDMPKRERTFYLDFTTEFGVKYEGHFTVKCRLTVAEKYAYELEKSRLLADQANPSNGLASLATVLAFLRSRIMAGPNWWQQGLGFNVEDEEALYELFAKIDSEIGEWKNELLKKVVEPTELGK